MLTQAVRSVFVQKQQLERAQPPQSIIDQFGAISALF